MSAVIVRLSAGETVGFAHARVVATDAVIGVYSTEGEGPLLAIYTLAYVIGAQIVDDGDPRIPTPDALALNLDEPCVSGFGGVFGAHALSLVEDGYVRVWQGVDFVRQPDGRIVVSEARDDNEAFLDGDGSGSYRLSCYRCGKSVAAEVTEDTSWK